MIPRSWVLHQSDRRLAQQTKLLKERNASLLRAVSAVKASGGSSAAQGGAEE
jgi:autophagy-related protein 16